MDVLLLYRLDIIAGLFVLFSVCFVLLFLYVLPVVWKHGSMNDPMPRNLADLIGRLRAVRELPKIIAGMLFLISIFLLILLLAKLPPSLLTEDQPKAVERSDLTHITPPLPRI